MTATRNERVHSPRTRRKRVRSSRLFIFLSAGLGFLTLINLCGPGYLTSQLDAHGPFFFSKLEREDPTKYTAKRIRKLERKVTAQIKGGASKVRSCRRYEQEGDQAVFGPKCQEKLRLMDPRNRKVVLYNPAPYERFWCKIKLAGKRTATLSEEDAMGLCKEPPRMSQTNPTVDGTDMPPIQMEIEGGIYFEESNTPNMQPFPCDIPCEHSPWDGDVIKYYKPKGMGVAITYSMESAQHYTELKIDEYAYRSNKYYATTSFRSEIPLPYFSWSEYNISSPAVDYDTAIRGASFLARNCESMSNREEIVRDLMKTTRVDSLSECLRNAQPPEVEDDGGLSGKIAIMRAYLFHLGFENSKEDDYVTEKLWGTLQSGTLPIYYGAPNVKEHVPPHSIISWHDFNDTEKLAKYVNKVANNKALYDSYHEWRTKPLPESFQKKFDFTKTHSVCRMCRWAYAKKYGFAWDYESQTVQNLRIPRELKYAMSGKVIQPFKDSWLLPGKGEGWQRTAWEHDGVIDIYFQAMPQSNSTVYRMETPIEGKFRANDPFHHIFTLQNDASRMTVVTSWQATVESPRSNTIDVTLENSFDILRVRVIIEDTDQFHKDADKVATYFGHFMANRDFFTPMEAFIVEGKRQEFDTAAQ